MTPDTTEPLADDMVEDGGLYLEKLAEALLRLGIVEIEGVVVDGSEVAGAIMALDAQLTAGWHLAEAVRWAKENEETLGLIDRAADTDAWETASRNRRYADEAVMAALLGWDQAAGLEHGEPGGPAAS